MNALPTPAARAALTQCCGARRWVAQMVAARPFASDAALLDVAERVWWNLPPEDWLEAFAQHPKIGERGSDAWSHREQAGVETAAADTRGALAEGNRSYETRFGHVFLICATGKSADQMLRELRRRLAHDRARELQVAAGEQAKITRLRLERLVTP